MCLKANFVKLVDVKTEELVQTPIAHVHQAMKEISANIKNAKMAKKQKNLKNVSVQESLTVNFARIACAKMVSVPTINATVPTISKESFVKSS
jgi:cytidine deaminase